METRASFGISVSLVWLTTAVILNGCMEHTNTWYSAFLTTQGAQRQPFMCVSFLHDTKPPPLKIHPDAITINETFAMSDMIAPPREQLEGEDGGEVVNPNWSQKGSLASDNFTGYSEYTKLPCPSLFRSGYVVR